MAHYDEQSACELLDDLTENPNISAQCRARGWASKLIWVWANESKKHKHEVDSGERTESKFYITWPSDELGQGDKRWFHECLNLAFTLHASNADLENRGHLSGYETPILDPRTNRPIYEIDDDLVLRFGDPSDPANVEFARTIGGCPHFPHKLDKHGRLIRMVKREAMAAALKQHTLRAICGSVYDISDKTEVNARVQSQVLVVGGAMTPQRERPVTDLVQSMEQKLLEIRSRGPANPTPESPVQVFGREASGDPPERIEGETPTKPADLRDHPRAYRAEPITETVKRAPQEPAYARPRQADGSTGVGYGPAIPGGMKTV